MSRLSTDGRTDNGRNVKIGLEFWNRICIKVSISHSPGHWQQITEVNWKLNHEQNQTEDNSLNGERLKWQPQGTVEWHQMFTQLSNSDCRQPNYILHLVRCQPRGWREQGQRREASRWGMWGQPNRPKFWTCTSLLFLQLEIYFQMRLEDKPSVWLSTPALRSCLQKKRKL